MQVAYLWYGSSFDRDQHLRTWLDNSQITAWVYQGPCDVYEHQVYIVFDAGDQDLTVLQLIHGSQITSDFDRGMTCMGPLAVDQLGKTGNVAELVYR